MDCLMEKDIPALTLGAALMGSGGGGTASYEPLMLATQIARYGVLPLMSVDELCDDDLVLPIAYMGAPSVSREKLPNGREIDTIVTLVEALYGRRPTVLLSAEMGGSNAFTAPLVAQRLGCRLLDADLIGRAFPRLEMSSPHLMGIAAAPAFIADSSARSAILYAPRAEEIERLARQVTIACGSTAAVGLYVMTGKEARKAVIRDTLSRACHWGHALLNARKADLPLGLFLEETLGCSVLTAGVVDEIETEAVDGFTVGKVTIAGAPSCTLWYKNEFLKAVVSDGSCRTTPSILALLDEESGVPVQTDMLQFGARVLVVAFAPPAVWESDAGLSLVGPHVFGL